MFVFGSQYLRGMTPDRSLWARDMEQMRGMGFNTIRAWLVWGVVEPARGQIDFDYIDELLDTAQKYELQVGLLFHLHGCPEWAIHDYPLYWYVNAQGRRFESSQRPNTPSGGWPGLCPDFPYVKMLEASFIESVAAHVNDHSALAFWEPINEPHMWIDLAENPPGAFCYCKATRQAFQEWLHQKYHTLEALGDAWGRRFSEWAHVRPPTWRFGYTDTVDFRTFTADNIAALVDSNSTFTGSYGNFAPGWGTQVYMSLVYTNDTYWTYLGSRSILGTGKVLDIDAGLQYSRVNEDYTIPTCRYSIRCRTESS